jgi:transcriptional regulator with XRE-family HTH domain
MKSTLAENIRTFRKEKKLTQEQLAEVFHVTVGAVHKWESGMSTPDLSIMMEMADFFDTSLDVLVGYQVRDNRIDVLAKRLRRLTDTMDPAGPSEAEKAIKKYPNSFRIIFECAYLFKARSAMLKIDHNYALRAKELYEQAIRLVSQNTDPNIDETHLYGQLAQVYQIIGDLDKSLEIFRSHNAGYVFNRHIGQILVDRGEYKEAENYLSYALVIQIGARVNLIICKALCYVGTGQFEEARAILEMGIKENELFRRKNTVSYLDRIDCLYYAGLSYVEIVLHNEDKAREYLETAKKNADLFDAAPDYDARRERFVDIQEPCMAYDTTGETCIEAIETAISYTKNKKLIKLWKSINQ